MNLQFHVGIVEANPRVQFLQEGGIVEQGRHQELMELGGRYFELVKLQSLERTE